MQVLRTVLLITGIGLWNTWQGKIKVSCDDGIRRILEHFGAVKTLVGQRARWVTVAHICWPEQGSWETDKVEEWHFSHAQISKKTSHLSTSPSALQSPHLAFNTWPNREVCSPQQPSQHPHSCSSLLSSQAVPTGHAHTHTPLLLWSFIAPPWVSSNVPAKYESRARIS